MLCTRWMLAPPTVLWLLLALVITPRASAFVQQQHFVRHSRPLRAAAAAVSMAGDRNKTICFIRHGVTEMNEFLGSSHYGSPGFKDPGLWDTRLTARGIAQAEVLNRRLHSHASAWAQTNKEIELIVSSPLSRALHTATLAFAGEPLSRIPRCINADVRERMWLSSDVGSPAGDLAEAWGKENWDCSALENTWWYTDESWRSGGVDWRKPGQYVHVGEPEQPFKQRLENFKAWLLARPELCIAVVAHWGSIYGLTGKSLENCEMLRISLSEFIDLPVLATD